MGNTTKSLTPTQEVRGWVSLPSLLPSSHSKCLRTHPRLNHWWVIWSPLCLGRQAGGSSSVLPYDYASLLLPPPDLLVKAAASISYQATTHVECEWQECVYVFPSGCCELMLSQLISSLYLFFFFSVRTSDTLWTTRSLGSGKKSSFNLYHLLFWERQMSFKLLQ